MIFHKVIQRPVSVWWSYDRNWAAYFWSTLYTCSNQTKARYLPEHCLPGGLLQQCSMCCNHGEQCLASTLAHCWPLVDTQITQTTVKVHPQRIKCRHATTARRITVRATSCHDFGLLILITTTDSRQIGTYARSVMGKVVRNVPL